MADERVVVKIDVDISGVQNITRLQKQLASMNRMNDRFMKRQSLINERFSAIKNRTDLVSRTFVRMRSIVGTMIGIFAKFNAILTVVATAALPLLNATFATGRLLAKAYHGALQLVAAGVAAVGAAAAVALAGFREYSAAMQSFNYTTNNNFLGATQNASASLRGLQRDAELAVFGLTGLNDAFVQVNQSSRFTGQSQNMLRQLADFAAAGGDPAKNIAAAGAFIGLLQKEGKLTQNVLAAGQKIGPQFAKALDEAKKRGMSSVADFQKLLSSGELAAFGGVTGQAGRVRQTLFGQLKGYMSQFFTMGADIGDSLLGPTKSALDQVAQSLMGVLRRVGPSIASFGRGPFLEGFVGMFLKLEEILIKLFREYLPRSEGMVGRFVSFWKELVYVFEDIVDRLRPYTEIGRAIMDIFGPAFTQIFERFGAKYQDIGVLIEDNREQFDRFGSNLERFVNLFFDFAKVLEESFVKALPVINALAEAFMTIAEMVLAIVGGIGQMGSMGGMAALGLMFGGKAMLGSKRGPGGRRTRGRAGRGMMRGARTMGGAINSALGPFGVLGGGFMPGMNSYGSGIGLANTTAFAGRGAYNAGIFTRNLASRASVGARNFVQDRIAARELRRLGFSPMEAREMNGGLLPGGGTATYTPKQYKKMFPFNRFGTSAISGPQAPPSHLMNFQQYSDAITKGTTRQSYRAYRAGTIGKAGMGIGASLKGALRSSARQGRFTRGYAPTGLGAGLASMMGSAALMNNFQFADTGLGSAGNTIGSMGSMVAMFNPMAGLGLTLAGGALGAKTPGGGALAGAGAGAAFGSMVGGPVGAAVGAVIGAAIGGVTGAINRFKGEEKKLKNDAQKVGLEVMGAVARSFIGTGDFSQVSDIAGKLGKRADYIRGLGLEGMDRDARKAEVARLRAEGKITREEADTLNAGVTKYVDGLDLQQEKILEVTEIIERGFNDKMDVLKSMTGKSTEELLALANTMGVDLYEATESVHSAVVALGLASMRTAEEIIGSVRDIQIEALDPLRKQLERGDLSDQLSQIEIAFRDLGSTATANDVNQLLLDYVDVLNVMNPDSPLTNLLHARDLINRGIAPGGFLEGQADIIRASGVQRTQDTAIETTRTNAIPSIARDIVAGLASQQNIAADFGQVSAMLSGLSPEQLQSVMNQLANGTLLNTFGHTGARGHGTGVLGGLGSFSYMHLNTQTSPFFDMLSDDQKTMYLGIQDAVKAGFGANPDWYADAPVWYNQNPSWFDPSDGTVPDTRTPRGDTTTQRLGRTLSRHNYFNSMLSGKRSITSAFRTTNLGSINSDHITGRAYDLVGQNLGQYASLVNNSGGFAEFHGRGGGRHLHVVPGETPMGDMSMPAIRPMSTPSASSNVYNYSVNVNGANADANEIASKVMDRIQRLDQNRRERR